jgi:hypothetical protein
MTRSSHLIAQETTNIFEDAAAFDTPVDVFDGRDQLVKLLYRQDVF